MKTNSRNKVVIITGVTGQAGSYFSDFLLEKDFKVVGTIRRLSVKNHKNIEHINNENFTLEPMDLGDVHSINSLVEKYEPDYFINCAANSFVGSSWQLPEQHIEYNTLGVLRQLEAIRRFSPHTKYYNFGSSEEFGDVQYSPQDESHPPRARSPYGASKIAARQLIKVYRESYELYAIQGWNFNYESERRGEEFVTRKITQNVARISKAYGQAKPFESLKLGNINSQRDWSHALDFVDGIWKMLNQDKHKILYGDEPKEYVLSSGETHTIKEFVEKSFAVAKIEGRWEGEGLDEKYVEIHNGSILVEIDPKFYRPAEVDLLLGGSTKAREELGWEPKVSFNELVEKMTKHDILNS